MLPFTIIKNRKSLMKMFSTTLGTNLKRELSRLRVSLLLDLVSIQIEHPLAEVLEEQLSEMLIFQVKTLYLLLLLEQ
jgi:hypothetical protein|tara:strand:- start:254 stop:484 length:231 start_codon:yes stop_codon:yes gene_type:complete